MEALLVKDELKSEMANYLEDAHSGKRLFTIFYIDMYLQVKTINKHRAILFIAYIEETFLILQHKIQHTDASVIGTLKTVLSTQKSWKIDFLYVFHTGTVSNKTMSNLIFVNKCQKIRLLIVLFLIVQF